LWQQIQADVYGRSVEIVEAEEGAAYGAALLAGVGGRVWASVDEACATAVRIRTVVEPETESMRLMDQRYQSYRLIYPALRGLAY
jgi:xylulokinase